MNIRIISKYIGRILKILSVTMMPGMLISVYKGEQKSVHAFVFAIVISFVIGQILTCIKSKENSIYNREGFAIVALSWIVISVFGALPFFLSGYIPNFLDAYFETVSGFTTTGASILTNVEALPMGLLYWRSFTHWLGGMGVLVFLLAIGFDKTSNSIKILRAESPGPAVGKLVPKMQRTARILYLIYIVMTVIEIILLLAGGMPLFDSICNAFGTAGTGGFAIKNASIGAYDSYYLQGVISVFMILFGINFNVYYLILLKDFKSVFKNQELRLYLGIILFSVITIALNTVHLFNNFFNALHHSLFQVSSIITTTGYATVDFNQWPVFSKTVLLILMIIGACAGSTGGGIKVSRLLILFKLLRNYIQRIIHPRSIKMIKIDGKEVSSEVTNGVISFMILYTVITVVSILIVSIENKSIETTVSAVFACINNIGPGLDAVGPKSNFFGLSYLSKFVLSLDMLLGRLELFPLIMLFAPSTWKKSK